MPRFDKTLIVELNMEYARQLQDILDGLIGEVEVCFDGVAAMRKYDSMKPDLLLVEAILPKQDGFAVLEHAKDDNAVKILLTAVNHDLMIRKAFALKADYLFVKPYDRDTFVERLLEVTELRQKAGGSDAGVLSETQVLKNRITSLLRMFGIPANIKGFRFLRETLMIAHEEPAAMESLRANLYEPIARQFDTSHQCVERNIRHAIEVSSIRGDAELYLKCFGYSVDSEKGKPTNAEFIAALTEELNDGR